MLNDTVGKNLKLLRLMQGMSQEDVEIGVDVSRSTLSKIENGIGKLDLSRLERFAKFFKVDVLTIITMTKSNDDRTVINPNLSPADEFKKSYGQADVELAACQEKVTALKKEISHLKQEIQVNKSQLKDKERIITLLSKEDK